MTNNSIEIKFAKQFPGKLNAITLNGDRTLRFLLEFQGVISAGDRVETMDVRVNGQKIELDHVLADGDIVLIFSLIKGNNDFITVRVGRAPGAAPESVVLQPNSTVAQAMVAAEIVTPSQIGDGSYDIFLNDTLTNEEMTLRDGDLVIIKNAQVAIGPEIGDEYSEDYENRNEDFGEDDQNETPSQKLYRFAETAERKSKLIRKIALECDTNEEFQNLMFQIFGTRPSRW